MDKKAVFRWANGDVEERVVPMDVHDSGRYIWPPYWTVPVFELRAFPPMGAHHGVAEAPTTTRTATFRRHKTDKGVTEYVEQG